MNIHRFSLYVAPEDICNKLMPNQKEQISNIIITSANLLGDVVHIECIALEKGIEIIPKEPSYRQSLMDNKYITAIET
ncbi:MAG: hypothetical protein E7583_01460 [Ruminococcaceae bacterium]|nr:hypothetical protein [Oscillospiraceae bacterium]